MDVNFEAVEALQPLTRLTYALLHSPLIATSQPGDHSDMAAATQSLWTALPPHDLACAVYPQLASYSDPHTLVGPLLSNIRWK